MNGYDCDTMRELLPAYVRNELLPHEKPAAASHLDVCASCAAEATVLRLVHDAQPTVPPELEARVLLAVRRPAQRALWQPARLALAATVAAAVLGGSLIVDRTGLLRRTTDPSRAMGSLDEGDASALSWAAAEDPLLHGSFALQQLSVEELELLLAELES
jgi:predicted anti-sigma-YlaC factor YlaD